MLARHAEVCGRQSSRRVVAKQLRSAAVVKGRSSPPSCSVREVEEEEGDERPAPFRWPNRQA